MSSRWSRLAACGPISAGSSDGASTDAGTNVEGGGSAGEGDGGGQAPNPDGGAAERCPAGRGPTMIRVGDKFCIDSTEVTQSQHLAFTQSQVGDTSGQLAACTGNTNYGAGCGFNPSARPDHPVEAVGWCDAFAFCKWAGKRLCGKPGDPNTQDPATIKQSGNNAWYAACTGGDAPDDEIPGMR